MLTLFVIATAIGLGAGWLIWGKGPHSPSFKHAHKAWYWLMPAIGLFGGMAMAIATINSRDGWDEFLIFVVLFWGWWIPVLLLVPFIGNQVKPHHGWGWAASAIGLPSAFVLGTALGAFMSNGF
ncbi:MAG: hypothetical protein VX730_02780 [Pseudomonadota bacterium]|nr:hypothetical protein [Pseudomonadota bacterium]